MKEVRYFFVPEASSMKELPQEEALHAAKVLRLEAGDEVFLMDGKGTFYTAELTLVSQKHCNYVIKDILPQHKAWTGNIHLAIAPTKNIDRIEWMVEKCTEIGWDSVTFLDCKFSERKQIRTDRIEKIVVSAVKQSRKPFCPKVVEMQSFRDFIHQQHEGRKYICHCYNEVDRVDFLHELDVNVQDGDDVTILVGPEGDFSIEEVREAVSNGYVSINLGDFRLRTETAGLMAVTMSQLKMRV